MRHAARTDANQRALVDALRRVGCHVVVLSAVRGLGFDLLVGWRRSWLTVEVKDPAQPPSARALTPSEAAHARVCAARGLPHVVALEVADVLRALGAEVAA